MLFAKVENNEIVEYPILSIQAKFPNISFCDPITEDQMPPGYVIIKEDEFPLVNSLTHKVEERTPTKRNGVWTRNLVVVALSEEESFHVNQFLLNEVSKKASELLQQTDWTQLPDVELKNKKEFALYRNAIRQIILNPSVNAQFPDIPQEIWE